MTGSGPSRHRTSEEGFGGEGKATLSIAESYTRRCRTHLFAITIMLSRSYPAVSSLVPCSSQSVRGVACAAAVVGRSSRLVCGFIACRWLYGTGLALLWSLSGWRITQAFLTGCTSHLGTDMLLLGLRSKAVFSASRVWWIMYVHQGTRKSYCV